MTGEKKQWFGRRAIEWVLDEAPTVPPNLVSTLVGLARHAQDDGTGAGPGVETLMGYTNKSRRQVKYDLDKLRELKLIKVSKDQSRVAHIRADRRPVVYDLAMGSECNPLHPEDAERGAIDCTPPKPRGAMQRSTGCNAASNEVQPIAPEENYEKNLEKINPSLSARTSVTAAREDADTRERDESTSSSTPNTTDPRHPMVIRHGCPEHLAEEVTEYIEGANPHVKGIGWWTHLDGNGHLAIHVQQALAAITRPADAPDPSWLCGTCGDTGWVTTDTGSALCGDCTNDGNDKCRNHPGQSSRNCGGCRGDRLAEANRQARTSERGNLPARTSQQPPVSQSSEGRNYDGWTIDVKAQMQEAMAAFNYPHPQPEAT